MILHSLKIVIDNPTLKPPCPSPSVVSKRKAGAPPVPSSQVKPMLPAPTIAQMAENFGGAVSRWIEGGYSVVSREEFDRRLTLCRACPFWDEKARFGMGKCNHPACGCTKGKMWLATERCPLSPPKW